MAARQFSGHGIELDDNTWSEIPASRWVQPSDQGRSAARRRRLHLPNWWSRKQRLGAHCRDSGPTDSSCTPRDWACDSTQGKHCHTGVQGVWKSSTEHIVGEEGKNGLISMRAEVASPVISVSTGTLIEFSAIGRGSVLNAGSRWPSIKWNLSLYSWQRCAGARLDWHAAFCAL